MKKITTIFALLLLCAVTATAQTTVTVIENTKDASTYGSLSGEVFTTNATSGMAGVTISGIKGTTATSFNYGACLALTSTQSGTITIKAPTGCIVESYTLTARSNTYSVPYTLTPSAGGTAVETSTGGITLSASGLTENTASFTYNASSANSFYIPSMTVVIRDPSATYVNITYQVVDKAKNVIFTSEPISTVSGTTITELPEIYKHSWFYDYASVSETADADKIVQVTATPKLFVPFTNFADATWYYVTLRGNKYVRVTSNEPYDTSDTNEETDAYQWAFSGNPYTGGVKMYNKTTGASKTVTKDGNNPVLRDGEYTWEILPNLDGFVLKAPGTANWYINNSNGNAKFGYWNSTAGRTDNGGTFRLTKVPGMEELLPQAKTLLTTLTNGANDVQIGYPTTDALSTFSNAIDAAEAGTLTVDELKAAIAAVKSPANTNYTPRTDVYYTITSARGSMIYHPDYVVTGKDISFLFHTGSTKQDGALNVALDKDNANHQWGFIEKDGKYYMYNVGKKQFANVTQEGSYQGGNGDKHTWMFSDHPSSVVLDAGTNNWVATPNVRVRATSEVTGKQYAMSISQSYDGPVIAYDDVNDGGIPMTFAVATTTQDEAVTTAIEALLEDLTPYRDALETAINDANALNGNVGEGVNKYTVTSGLEDFEQALADAQAELAKEDSETSKAALIAAREALEAAIAAMTKTLNMPQAGFYRIKGNTSGKYVSNGGGDGAKYTMTETADETTIFCYDGEKLINYKTGLCFNMPGWTWAYGNESVATTFLDGLSNGGYAIQNGETGNGKLHLYDAGSSCDRGGFDPATMSTQNTRYREWYLEEVTELPITLRSTDNETYFATFSAPVNVQISGASLNNVQKDGNTATFTTVNTNVLKAGVGVLLSGTSESATATIITDEVPDANYGLVGYYAATAGTGDATKFYLGKSKKSGQAGFYKLGSGTTSNGFKAYLENTTGEAKEGFDLEFAGVTGIDNMENGTLNMNNGAVYNLQGQRVNKAQKGVFIQNGKKVVVR